MGFIGLRFCIRRVNTPAIRSIRLIRDGDNWSEARMSSRQGDHLDVPVLDFPETTAVDEASTYIEGRIYEALKRKYQTIVWNA